MNETSPSRRRAAAIASMVFCEMLSTRLPVVQNLQRTIPLHVSEVEPARLAEGYRTCVCGEEVSLLKSAEKLREVVLPRLLAVVPGPVQAGVAPFPQFGRIAASDAFNRATSLATAGYSSRA